MTTEQKWADFGSDIALLMAKVVLMLIMAWPLMWAWNYIIPSLFGLNRLAWGESFCLFFVMGTLLGGVKYLPRNR